MPYRNLTGKCRRGLHIMDEVGRTRQGACRACTSEADKARSKLRDHSRSRRTTQPKPRPTTTFIPSSDPYIPGHALTIDDKIKVGRCTCGTTFRGTRNEIKPQHQSHLSATRNIQSQNDRDNPNIVDTAVV